MGLAEMSHVTGPSMYLVCGGIVILSCLSSPSKSDWHGDFYSGFVLCMTPGLFHFTTLLWEWQEGKEGTKGSGLELPDVRQQPAGAWLRSARVRKPELSDNSFLALA